MTDRFGRKITYIRLPVTGLCNLRCVYWMPETGVKKTRGLCNAQVGHIRDSSWGRENMCR
jgi:cyclic pyranopterin phosphate synthase